MTKCDLRIKREFIQEVRATAQFYAKQHSTSVVSIISGNDLQTTFKGVNAQGNFKAANALKGVLKKVYKVDGELIKYSEGNIGINLGISDEAIKPIVEIVNSGTILISSSKLKISLGKELEYKDSYAKNRIKDFKKYEVLNENGNNIGTVVIENRGNKTVILHPELSVIGKGYGKELYKYISSKLGVTIQEWAEGAISKSDSAKKMWDSLEKEGSAIRIVDEEQGDNFRQLTYKPEITSQPFTDAVQTTLFSLNTKLDGAANIKLDTLLKKYLEPYNFTYADIEDIKIKYQVNSLGAIDLLQKVIFLAENRRLDTMPEEFSHALVMLMGKENPMVSELRGYISTWSGYSKVFKNYHDLYNGNIEKIKVEAIGQLLSKALVQKFKSDNKIEQDWFTKLKQFFTNFFKSFKQNDTLVKNIAERIAADVLNGKNLVDSPNLNSKRLLNYSKAVEQVPLAKEIIHEYTVNRPFNLTGSLALAKNESAIYRDPSEPVHDLDFQIPYLYTQKHPDILEFFKSMNKSNIEKAHNGYGKPNEITYSFFILKKGYTFDKLKTISNINSKILQPYLDLTVLNSKKEVVPIKELVENKILMGVDFFWPLKNNQSTNLNGAVSTRSTYEGKLQLSNYNESPNVLFDRLKDQHDYIASTVPNPEPSLQRDLYFQLNDNERRLDFDELDKNRDMIHKYFENLNQEVSVSSPLDALKIVDQKDIQNFINNCK